MKYSKGDAVFMDWDGYKNLSGGKSQRCNAELFRAPHSCLQRLLYYGFDRPL